MAAIVVSVAVLASSLAAIAPPVGLFGAVPAGAATVTPSTPSPPPGQDTFYQPPSGYASTAPGAVLASRLDGAALYGNFPLRV
ncbi:MAG: hypothetical protein ACYCV7_10355 [Acidimicrobiales bacterium]